MANNPAPVTEDAFLADRMRFWSGFTGATTWACVAIAVLLGLLAYFLV
jgi:hypothetical protein